MARLSKRTRVRLAVTTDLPDQDAPVVLHTRDVSATGLFLETTHFVSPRYRLALSVVDPASGDAVEIEGEVTRIVEPVAEGGLSGVGVRLVRAPADWLQLVRRLEAKAAEGRNSTRFRTLRRFSVLVVGTEERRRHALALYVHSGWNVRFAASLADAEEALRGFHADAVIVEHELDEPTRLGVLELARREQPEARRIVRLHVPGVGARLTGVPEQYAGLADRAVDADTGLEGVLEAIGLDDKVSTAR